MIAQSVNEFSSYLVGVQQHMKDFRKRLTVKNDHEWNAKAQLVFVSEHMDCAMRNLRRSVDGDGRND
jgi:hypothetical protein